MISLNYNNYARGIMLNTRNKSHNMKPYVFVYPLENSHALNSGHRDV